MSLCKEIGLMGIFSVLHPPKADSTLFLNAYQTLPKIDQFMSHKANFHKSQKTKTMSTALSDHYFEIRNQQTEREKKHKELDINK